MKGKKICPFMEGRACLKDRCALWVPRYRKTNHIPMPEKMEVWSYDIIREGFCGLGKAACYEDQDVTVKKLNGEDDEE